MEGKDIALESYLKEIRAYPLLTAQQERSVVLKHHEGDLKARESLINSNLRLVVNIAKRYINCGIAFSDLIAEGNIGLIYAVERFDPSKGCRFSTYANCWIKHSICRAITEKKPLVRIPAYMKKILSQCKEKTNEIVKKSGKMPTTTELIDKLAIPNSQRKIVNEALITSRAMDRMQSIQALNLNQDCIADFKQQESIDRFINKSEIDWIIKYLNSMEPKRAQIIKMRFGLNGDPKMTLKEVASHLHLTKERIRQIEKETLNMLKKSLQKNDFLG